VFGGREGEQGTQGKRGEKKGLSDTWGAAAGPSTSAEQRQTRAGQEAKWLTYAARTQLWGQVETTNLMFHSELLFTTSSYSQLPA